MNSGSVGAGSVEITSCMGSGVADGTETSAISMRVASQSPHKGR